jgi:hypothetical protein
VAEHLTEELAGDLFLAAAARENIRAMNLIGSIKPGAVPAAAVYAALAEAVQQEQTDIVSHLCQGAASVCDSVSLVPLLLAALEQGYKEGLEALVGLAGSGLEAAQLLTLLHAALEHGNSQFLSVLVQLPAAKQLQWVECEALLGSALKLSRQGVSGLVRLLVTELPAVSESMTFSHVYEIFQVAAQQRDNDGLLQNAQLPAVQRAAPAQLQQLLLVVLEMLSAAVSDNDAHADLSASSIEVCVAVLKLKPAQQLDSDMTSLLEASFSVAQQAPTSADGIQLTSVWMALCQLPLAANLDHASIISLLETSLSKSAARFGHSGTAALCSLLEQKSAQAAWEGLTRQQAEQLLTHAVPTKNGGSMLGPKE